ncbi:hypothetical protein [Fictibacillus barbaricus]|uniref:Uncharacterized protein n=1 Tax=Fictibacillus barbaricus TaxID=182136 RepID=A0ABU1U1E3_9BACL|nr:hypothetical protein [Fictibacillus barbaricus]MDR7073269.1 hypothetical protein [Fictibacillus barbaricus]
MQIQRGNYVTYQDELHIVLHVYTSDYLEIRKVDEDYVPRVILVHQSEVVIQG